MASGVQHYCGLLLGVPWEKEGMQGDMSYIFPCRFVSLVSDPLSFTPDSSATSPAQVSISTQTSQWILEPAWS